MPDKKTILAVLGTAVIAIVAVVYIYPLIRPHLQKLPVVGKWL